MQDTANITVFLPRTLSGGQFMMFLIIVFLILGVIFYFRGGRIQSIVTEKHDVTRLKAATMIDFVFAIVLLVFKEWNSLPMSTTWVFLGLLAGREVILTHFSSVKTEAKVTLKLIGKDIGLASIGLVISMVLSAMIRSESFL